MPIINIIKKFFKRILIGLFLSFMLYHWAKWYFPENWFAKKYIKFYENFLAVSEDVLKEKVPGLSNYFAKSEKENQKKALDNLMNWDWNILDRMWWVFQAMDKYVMIQQWLLVMKDPSLAKEFSTAWMWDVMKSIDAMKNYKKMESEVYKDAWMSDDQSYMTFQEIIQYWKLVDQINKWKKTEQDLVYFLAHLSKKTKQTEDLKNSLMKIANEKIKENWWDLKKTFDKTMDKITNQDVSDDSIIAK